MAGHTQSGSSLMSASEQSLLNEAWGTTSEQTVINAPLNHNNGNNGSPMETDKGQTNEQAKTKSIPRLRDSQMASLVEQITNNLRIQQPNLPRDNGKRKRDSSPDGSTDGDQDNKRGKPNIPARYLEVYRTARNLATKVEKYKSILRVLCKYDMTCKDSHLVPPQLEVSHYYFYCLPKDPNTVTIPIHKHNTEPENNGTTTITMEQWPTPLFQHSKQWNNGTTQYLDIIVSTEPTTGTVEYHTTTPQNTRGHSNTAMPSHIEQWNKGKELKVPYNGYQHKQFFCYIDNIMTTYHNKCHIIHMSTDTLEQQMLAHTPTDTNLSF